MTENEIATIIVDAAYKIHKRLGPGLLESVYETTLAYELAAWLTIAETTGNAGLLRVCSNGCRISR